uniref:Phytocyanin domain-containing protein n=1 Tax=Kalanchoe fedtschenkoi TaxID=63787 RepID=A0A7N0TY27_KALFE
MAGSVRALVLAVAVTVSLFALHCEAKDFIVGGSMSWEVPPSDNRQLYNQWAEKNRFMIGDSLVFTYDAGKDSVLQVDKDAYDNCKTDSHIQSYKDGHTVVKLNRSGPFYFISGNEENCKKNEKLVVVVLSERRKSAPPSPQPSPAPSGEVPTSSPPSPSAPGSSPPSPSPSGTSDMVPSSPPESDDAAHKKKKNGASSTLLGAFASVGAFMGTFLVLVL